MKDDTALMLLVQKGELQHLSTLFRQHYSSLFNYFMRMGNSRNVSEDLVQETFVKILTHRHSFQGSASFKSWMFSIGRNTMVDHYRKNKSLHDAIGDANVELCETSTLDQEQEKLQQQNLFEKALMMLPREAREILILSRFNQLPYEEIADMMGCNLNTLKSRFRKAISILHDNYAALTQGET